MKIFIGLLLIVSTILDQNYKISEVRSLYIKATQEEAAAHKLIEFTSHGNSSEPLMLGYRAAAHMMLAKHVGNPFKKLSNFYQGKEIFTKAVNAAPASVELRFLRFSVQAEAPAFLNYRENLEEDKKILLEQTSDLKNTGLKKMIMDYLISSQGLSDSEKEKL